MKRMLLAAVGLVLLGAGALGADKTPLTAAEMKVLLEKGLLVSSMDIDRGKAFTARIDLAANGRLSGTLTPSGHQAISLSGTWKLKGAQICRTLEPIEPQEVCETWFKSGPKEVTVQVNGQDVSLNRWQ